MREVMVRVKQGEKLPKVGESWDCQSLLTNMKYTLHVYKIISINWWWTGDEEKPNDGSLVISLMGEDVTNAAEGPSASK